MSKFFLICFFPIFTFLSAFLRGGGCASGRYETQIAELQSEVTRLQHELDAQTARLQELLGFLPPGEAHTTLNLFLLKCQRLSAYHVFLFFFFFSFFFLIRQSYYGA